MDPVRRELLHPIACEPCRQKKCKCDREIPVCSQCLGEPSKCSYPESGRRGLPLGYLSQLEQRLADTELALFEALATLRSLGHGETALVKASVKPGNKSRQGKQARMEEWARLPLRDGMTQDIRTWWQAKAEIYSTHEPTEGWTQAQRNPISISYSPAASVVETTVSTSTPPKSQGKLHYGSDVLRQPPPETVTSRDATQHNMSEISTGYSSLMPRDSSDSEALSSYEVRIFDGIEGDKAATLASTQSHLYF